MILSMYFIDVSFLEMWSDLESTCLFSISAFVALRLPPFYAGEQARGFQSDPSAAKSPGSQRRLLVFLGCPTSDKRYGLACDCRGRVVRWHPPLAQAPSVIHRRGQERSYASLQPLRTHFLVSSSWKIKHEFSKSCSIFPSPISARMAIIRRKSSSSILPRNSMNSSLQTYSFNSSLVTAILLSEGHFVTKVHRLICSIIWHMIGSSFVSREAVIAAHFQNSIYCSQHLSFLSTRASRRFSIRSKHCWIAWKPKASSRSKSQTIFPMRAPICRAPPCFFRSWWVVVSTEIPIFGISHTPSRLEVGK